MKTNFKLITAFLFGFFCQIGLAAQSDTYAKIQKAVDDFRAQYKIPAVQVSVSMPDEYTTLNFVSGTTIKDGKNKLTPGDLFQFGSNTKSFTAAIILQLEAEGKLNINDTIGKYLPQYPQWQDITIKQMLHHTSGIFNYTEDNSFSIEVWKNPNRIWKPAELVSFAADEPSYFQPGMGYHYSNTNFILAGMIITKVTGNSYASEINNRLLGPSNLNLVSTYYADQYSADIMSHLAHGYSTFDLSQHITTFQDVTYPTISWGGSAGAIVSNTQDFTRWPRLLFQQGKVIDPTRLAEMQELVCMDSSEQSNCKPGQPVTPDIGGYGLGVGSVQLPPYGIVWAHDGGTFGYLTNFVWIPKYNTSLAVAINATLERADQVALMAKILSILYSSAEWQSYRITNNIVYTPNISEKDLGATLEKLNFSNDM